MSTQFIINAIRDILPTLQEPYPKELVEYTNSLYSLSKVKQVLNPQYEIARYHLCCYLTVEKFRSRLSLPEPMFEKIPIPGRKLRSVMLEFKGGLTKRKETASQVTPRKRRRRYDQLPTPRSTGKRTHRSPTKASFNPYLTPESARSSKHSQIIDIDSNDFKPKSGKSMRARLMAAAQETSQSESGAQRSVKRKITRSPKKLTTRRSTGTKREITTALLISFCNRFYIPEDTTKNIMDTYRTYHLRIRNPWGLLCGLTAVAFICLNSDIVNNKIGVRSKLYRTLQKYQSGGLTIDNIKEWTHIVQTLCSEEPWIKILQERNGTGNEMQKFHGIPSLTTFIGQDVCYNSNEASKSYNNWLKELQQTIH